MAAMPPVKLRKVTRCEAGLADHASKAALVGEGADAFDQVAIGFGRAGGQGAEPRDDLEGMKIVQPVEHGHIAAGKFQAQKAPARA